MEQQQAGDYQVLFATPKPRSVRVKAVPRIILAACPLASVFLIYSGIQEIRSLRQIDTHSSPFGAIVSGFIFAAILIAISSVTFWIVRRDLILLRDGELAAGVVTHQMLVNVRRGKESRVRYRFKKTRPGKCFRAEARITLAALAWG